MKKFNAFATFILINLSCFGQSDSINCNNAIEKFKLNWEYLDSLDYYQTKLSPKDIPFYSKCFSGIDTNLIKKVFGEPSDKTLSSKRWDYYFHKFDRGKLIHGSWWKIGYEDTGIFIYIENGKLKNIEWKYNLPIYQPDKGIE